MKTYLCLALTMLVAGCGAFASVALTQANLDKIHNDMTPIEVKAILGAPTSSETKPIAIVGGNETIYTYRSKSSEVTIIFKNDLVKEKHGSFDQ